MDLGLISRLAITLTKYKIINIDIFDLRVKCRTPHITKKSCGCGSIDYAIVN